MATHESLNLKKENRIAPMYDWADTAVVRVRNFADCLTWQGNVEEQAEFLGHFVGELIDCREALATQDPPFNFDIFAHAIPHGVARHL